MPHSEASGQVFEIVTVGLSVERTSTGAPIHSTIFIEPNQVICVRHTSAKGKTVSYELEVTDKAMTFRRAKT